MWVPFAASEDARPVLKKPADTLSAQPARLGKGRTASGFPEGKVLIVFAEEGDIFITTKYQYVVTFQTKRVPRFLPGGKRFSRIPA